MPNDSTKVKRIRNYSRMIQPFETSKGKFLAVKMPDLFVSAISNMGYLLIKTWNKSNGVTMEQLEDYDKLQKYLEKHDTSKEYNQQAIKITDGDWKVIGLAEKISEEQAGDIVFRAKTGRYRNYTHQDVDLDEVGLLNALLLNKFETAKESFLSLMESVNCYSVNPFPEPNKEDYNMGNHIADGGRVHFSFDKIRSKKAQERTGSWLILKEVK